MKPFSRFRENKLFHVYFILMLLVYVGYIVLDNYRYKFSETMKKSFFTQEDIHNFTQLGKWTSIFEIMFLLVFIVSMIICCYKKDMKILKDFVLVNIALFIGIAGMGYVLSLITPTPIGNLLEPLLVPAYLIGGLLIYMLWRLIKKRKLVE